MRYILFFVVFFATPSFAANCIINKDNQVMSKTGYYPDIADLESRGDFVVQCSDDIVIGDADYKNGKVVKHIETKAERDAKEAAAQAKAKKEADKLTASTKLKALGLTDDEISAIGL